MIGTTFGLMTLGYVFNLDVVSFLSILLGGRFIGGAVLSLSKARIMRNELLTRTGGVRT